MPVHKVEGGYKWGSHGKVYPTREGAEKQAAAAYANGYTGDNVNAAGMALRAPSGKLLFLKRSDNGDHPGEWCFPGGRMEGSEDPWQAAIREAQEELGPAGHFTPGEPSVVDVRHGFTTFAVEVPEEFTPTLNEEHTEHKWAIPERAPQPLHPGVAETLNMIDDAATPKFTGTVDGLVQRGYPTQQAVRMAYDEMTRIDIRERLVKDADNNVRDFAGYYTAEKVGQTRKLTPEGYLLLENTPIARVGEQLYAPNEVDGVEPNKQGYIIVERRSEEVFRPETLASFEGKDYVIEHPPDGVDVKNWKNKAVGHVQNVRRGEGIEDDLVIADIFVKEPWAIEYVNKRLPHNSAGYRCDYEQLEPGRAVQRNIIGNHVAAVETGRAGARVAVRDHSVDLPSGDIEMPTPAKKPTLWAAVKSALTSSGVKTEDADRTVGQLATTFDAAAESEEEEEAYNAKDMSKDMKAVKDWIKARDAEREEEKKEEKEKEAKDAKARDEEAAKKTAHAAELAQHEAVGDTIIEAEGPGMVVNLGKTWTGSLTGDAAAREPVLSAVNARAEILVPGVPKLTADAVKGNNGTVLAGFIRSVIEQHARTSAGKVTVQSIVGDAAVGELKGHRLVSAFNAVAQLARVRNNTSSSVRRPTTPVKDNGAPQSIADINKANRDFWEKRSAEARDVLRR